MEEQINNEQILVPQSETTFKYFPFYNRKQPLFILALIGIIFYCTSLYNEYALDDGIIIHQNSYVLKGITGIKDILSKDAYHSFYKRMNATDQLQGGRYRPLATVSFALEQEAIGTYRTGYYLFVEDLNKNGVLDNKKEPWMANYEYNEFVDLNKDNIAQEKECNTCWDANKNFRNDASEDLNHDGVFNEVDCQVNGAFLRHFNNVWTYILACILLYLVFSRYMFKDNQDLAFLAAMIFLTHPVHSEIVANVKGREDIFSLIFISLTFLFAFKFMENKKIGTLIITGIVFLLALLSKEYAIMLVLLVPVAMYVFNKIKVDWRNLSLLTVSFLIIALLMAVIKLKLPTMIPDFIFVFSGLLVFIALVFGLFKKTFLNKELNSVMIVLYGFSLLYIGFRLMAVSIAPGVPDTELLNNPYLLATGEERFASKIFVLLKYLVLSVFPNTLTSDYSYAQIAYRNFTDVSFLISLLLNLTLLVLGIKLVVKRHVVGFAIISYFAFLLLATNFIFDIGAVMREGFLFHASIGVAIAFAWLILKGFDRMQSVSFATRRTVLISSLAVIVFLYGCKTWERNWDWKNDVTLFLKDVKTSPHSVLVLGNAGARWVDLADTKEITGKALPGEDSTMFNDYNGTLKITEEEMKAGGYKDKREAALNKGLGYLKHAVELHPRYVNGYLNAGLASFKLGNDRDAIFYWKQAENLYPNNPYLRNYYIVYYNILNNRGMDALKEGKFYDAAVNYKMATIVDAFNAEAWDNLANAFDKLNRPDKAKLCREKALKLNDRSEPVKKTSKNGC